MRNDNGSPTLVIKVPLQEAGTVRLVAHIDFENLHGPDRDFVLGLVNTFCNYPKRASDATKG